MKKIYSFSLILLSIVVFTSCKKDYNCTCKINYVVNGKVVNTNTSVNTIKAVNEDEAAKQCVYFEREENYIQQQAIVQHYCGIK